MKLISGLAPLLLSAGVATAAAAQADTALLNAAYITGSHYSARQLMPAYLADVGQPVTADRIEAISRRVEQMYARDGYLVPLVVVQEGSSTTPHLHVFEARVAGVRVRGDAGVHRAHVARVAARLEAQAVLHKAQTQAAVRELEELPGLRVRTTIVPVESQPNAYALSLEVAFEGTEGGIGVTNRISADIGDALLHGRIVLNGKLGLRERLTFQAASSSTVGAYSYFSGRAERRFGIARLDLLASHAQARTDSDSDYVADRFALEASVTLLRRQGLSLSPLAGVALRNARDEDSAGDAWSSTRTRNVEVGVELVERSDSAATRARASAVRGLDAWNAAAYRRNGAAPDTQFDKLVLYLTHSRLLAPGWQVRAAFEGQWSAEDLPPGERFAYGGSQFGRAFDSGEIVADSGGTGSLQLEHSRRWNNPWLDYGRAYVQADYGVGRDNGAVDERALRGASVSVGFAARTRGLTSTLELGHALKRPLPVQDARDLRAFLGTSYAF